MTYVFWSDCPEKSGAYRLLQYAVRERLGFPCPKIVKDAHGKPYFPSRPEIRFSLSHTRGAVMVCLGDAPCGCDIELIRPVRPGVPLRVCAPEELAEFDFFQLWTLKESLYKLRGHWEKPLWAAVFSRSPERILSPDPAVTCALFPLGAYQSAVCSLSPVDAPVFVSDNDLTNLLQSGEK